MLQAQLKGKLRRDEEEMEDLLTSNVFGSIEYSGDTQVFEEILHQAEASDGSRPLFDLTVTKAAFDFWPLLEHPGCNPCEPDVTIMAELSGRRRMLVLIESKFHSPKSSFGDETQAVPTDQLAKEWDNLLPEARFKEAEPIILYVTADFLFPTADIAEALTNFNNKREGLPAPRVMWISWRAVRIILGRCGQRMLKDAAEILRSLGLVFFEGISSGPAFKTSWSYVSEISRWDWTSISLHLTGWKFEGYRDKGELK